jgi:hypothetical protein
VGSGTMSADNPRKTYLNFRNSNAMLYKNSPAGSLWWKMSLKLCLDLIAAFRFLLMRKHKDAEAVMNAVRHFWQHRPMWSVRRSDSPYRTKGAGRKRGIYPGLLVVAYFIRKKKTFSSLGLR